MVSARTLGPRVTKVLVETAEENRKRKAKGDYGYRIDPKTGKTDYESPEGKAALVALKEELFFTIEEKSHDADLTELGRNYLNPDDPNAFMLPDLLTEFADIENDPSISPADKTSKKSERQQHCDAQAERIHNITQLVKAYCLYEKDVEYVVEENNNIKKFK